MPWGTVIDVFWDPHALSPVGVTDRKITGAKFQLYKNAGWSSDCSPSIVETAILHLDGSYHFPAFQVRILLPLFRHIQLTYYLTGDRGDVSDQHGQQHRLPSVRRPARPPRTGEHGGILKIHPSPVN